VQAGNKKQYWKNAFVLLMVPAHNFLVQASEVLPENPSVLAGGPAIPRTIDVEEQGPTSVPKLYYQKVAK